LKILLDIRIKRNAFSAGNVIDLKGHGNEEIPEIKIA
jgi:hypothetical protein